MIPKLKPWMIPGTEIVAAYNFYCPGCKRGHVFYCNKDYHPVAWGFNGDREKPSFTPSLKLYIPSHKDPDTGINVEEKTICHLFLTNGQIQFLSDCEHALKGQTVQMVDWPEGYQV